jgi:aryl-alcohol dehydrogenase-like predicted oxidoreductase
MENTKLGFGCAPMLGRIGKRESLQAMALAYSHGITYFDIARSYGWGEAEFLLGEFIAHNQIPRESVEITTKFGLTPRNNKWIRTTKKIARGLIEYIPQTKKLVKTAAQTAAPKVQFTLDSAKQSLEISLNALKTDYIDNFLFHEYDFQNMSYQFTEILLFLDSQKKSGKIKNYGFSISCELKEINAFLERQNITPDILQMPCSWFKDDERYILQNLRKKGVKIILHSPFKFKPDLFLDFLKSKALLLTFESSMERDINFVTDLYGVYLAYFKVTYSPYCLITSMFNLSHIEANVKTFQYSQINKKQAQLFEQLIKEFLSIQP